MSSIEFISGIIAKLESWQERDFHKDRQLADEVLIADGWNVEADPTWEGGERWYYGKWPQYSCGAPTRPHVINNLDAALGVVPPAHNIEIVILPNVRAGAKISSAGDAEKFTGTGPIASVAVLIAALKAKLALLEAA